MSQFRIDDEFQADVSRKFLVPIYDELKEQAHIANWRRPKDLREQGYGDALFLLQSGRVLGLEEKLVRWPKGRTDPYTAATLETHSCTVPGHERDGWMVTGKYHLLLYGRLSSDQQALDCDLYWFRPLQTWFLSQPLERWPRTITDQINRTECRVVPFADMRAACAVLLFRLPLSFPLDAGFEAAAKEFFGVVEAPSYRCSAPFEHHCHCGKWGSFGYGVALRKGMLGQWFCREHRPDAPTAPEPRGFVFLERPGYELMGVERDAPNE